MEPRKPKKSLSFLRVLAIVAAVVGVLVLVAWKYGYLGSAGAFRPSNSIMVIEPYKFAGTWVFNDYATGLRQEPFVEGIPEMMDDMVKGIPNADQGFRLTFSGTEFPGYTHKLVWRRTGNAGNWYYCEQLKFEGWLCPALLRYFKEPPKEIYAKADPKQRWPQAGLVLQFEAGPRWHVAGSHELRVMRPVAVVSSVSFGSA
jgi:hypothetical protein